MSLTILSANTKRRAVPFVADRADFVSGPQLQNGTEYELVFQKAEWLSWLKFTEKLL